MRHTRRMIMLLLTVLALTGVCGVLAPKAAAPRLSSREATYFALDPPALFTIDIIGATSKSQIAELKSSRNDVATVEIEKNPRYSKYVRLVVEPRSPGKTTVSFKVKYGSKTKKLTFRATVRKYENVCASFKVGSKNYASKFNKKMFVTAGNPKKSRKISVEAKKGWKLLHIRLYTKNGRETLIDNNTTVNLKKYRQIYADFYSGKLDASSTLVLDMY